MNLYIPPDMALWRGRVDHEEGLLGRRWHEWVAAWQEGAAAGTVLLGFACDAGVARNQGRVGASQGPDAMRRVLANLPWHQQRPLHDAGNVCCDGDALEAAQAELSARIAMVMRQGQFPLVLGGGHEMAYGSFQGLARFAESQSQQPRIGIINFDAHFDLRAGDRASSGTPFRQIAESCAARGEAFRYLVFGISRAANTQALFERAKTLGVRWVEDIACGREWLEVLKATLADFAAEVDWLYLTICLDVLPAAVAPGVSAPAAYGMELAVLEALIEAVKATGKLKLADIAELNPAFDRDAQTAKVAARLAWRLA